MQVVIGRQKGIIWWIITPKKNLSSSSKKQSHRNYIHDSGKSTQVLRTITY